MTQSNSDVTGETNLDNFQIEEKKTREKIVTEWELFLNLFMSSSETTQKMDGIFWKDNRKM